MKKSGGINIGTSSILVIFVLLALVTFASLSYLSAKSDYVLSKEAADRTACYYDANRMAELYMANIEGLLSKYKYSVGNEDEYKAGIEELFSDNSNIIVDTEEEIVSLSYQVPVTKGQNIDVKLIAHYPDDEDYRLFYIEKWSTSINQEWLDEVKSGSAHKSGVKFLFED